MLWNINFIICFPTLTAAEITIQPTVEEASDNCTQECLIWATWCLLDASFSDAFQTLTGTGLCLCHSPPTQTSLARTQPSGDTDSCSLPQPSTSQAAALMPQPSTSTDLCSPHHSPPLAQALCHSLYQHRPQPLTTASLAQAVIHCSPPATACCPSSQPCTTTNVACSRVGGKVLALKDYFLDQRSTR